MSEASAYNPPVSAVSEGAKEYSAGVIATLLVRIAQLKSALQPFAAAADLHLDNTDLPDETNVGVLLTLGELRGARAVLAPDPDECASMPEHLCWTVLPTSYMRSADRNERYHAVYFQKPPRRTENGISHGLNFPALIVPSYVEQPEDFARKVAAILNECWPKGDAV